MFCCEIKKVSSNYLHIKVVKILQELVESEPKTYRIHQYPLLSGVLFQLRKFSLPGSLFLLPTVASLQRLSDASSSSSPMMLSSS